MLLVVDVGNTNTVFGVYKDEELLGNWRMFTKVNQTTDEYAMSMLNILKFNGINYEKIDRVVISSVVPHVMHSLVNCMNKYLKLDPIIVGPGLKTGLKIRSENPKEIGADRIVDSVAAFEIYGGPIIAIDFGTATTYDYINENFEFMYGITSPGIKISADALWTKTAKLPNIEIIKPETILARNTITSMQAGLVYGCIGQTEYIIKKMKEEIGRDDIKVVATGGLGRIISDETDLIDVHDSLLMLRGLKIISDKND